MISGIIKVKVSLQNRRAFCIFWANKGGNEASAKHESRARERVRKNNSMLAEASPGKEPLLVGSFFFSRLHRFCLCLPEIRKKKSHACSAG